MRRQKITAAILRVFVYAATCVTIGALLFVVSYILYKAYPISRSTL
jgi:hypothetical protein